MQIITGDLDGNKLRVWQIMPGEDQKGNKLTHPNGYNVDKVPEYPKRRKGTDDILYYDIEKKEFFFETKERPFTQEESIQEISETLKDILEVLKIGTQKEVK